MIFQVLIRKVVAKIRNNGYYPNPDKFLDTMDKVFSDFADTMPKKGNQSFTTSFYIISVVS